MTMNPYSTQEAAQRKKCDIIILLICGLFAAADVSAVINLFSDGKALAAVIGIIFLAALIMPIVRTLVHAFRAASAKRIAEALAPLTVEALTFEQFQSAVSSGNALKQLKSLIGKGYLQNLQINPETQTITLYSPENAFIQWVCPNCGAKNRERKGGALRCKYCEQPFVSYQGGKQ